MVLFGHLVTLNNMDVVNLSQKMTNNLLKVTDWGRVMGK
jgi:hypothetical protein